MAVSDVKNFDQFIAIDWTGARHPVVSKAIAVAACQQNKNPPEVLQGPWSRRRVADMIAERAQESSRILIGIDCNFGYAQETGLRQLGPDYDYRDLWRAVDESSRAEENYFAGPYWQNHPEIFWTSGKMPAGFAMPRRITEQMCGEAGYGWPESPFKLIGAKQVGKGGLAGMRMAYDLKRRCGDKIAIWPFEPEIIDHAHVIIAEIYPRQFLKRAGHGNTKVRHLADLNRALALLESKPADMGEFSDHTADAVVSAAGLRWLCGSARTILQSISQPPCDPVTLRREGWIFGVGDVPA